MKNHVTIIRLMLLAICTSMLTACEKSEKSYTKLALPGWST